MEQARQQLTDLREEATNEKLLPISWQVFGQHELHSFELSVCGISSLGSRMELGMNSSAKKNPGIMGLGPAALCQLLSSWNIGAQWALSREINDVLWIIPLQRTQREILTFRQH